MVIGSIATDLIQPCKGTTRRISALTRCREKPDRRKGCVLHGTKPTSISAWFACDWFQLLSPCNKFGAKLACFLLLCAWPSGRRRRIKSPSQGHSQTWLASCTPERSSITLEDSSTVLTNTQHGSWNDNESIRGHCITRYRYRPSYHSSLTSIIWLGCDIVLALIFKLFSESFWKCAKMWQIIQFLQNRQIYHYFINTDSVERLSLIWCSEEFFRLLATSESRMSVKNLTGWEGLIRNKSFVSTSFFVRNGVQIILQNYLWKYNQGRYGKMKANFQFKNNFHVSVKSKIMKSG